MADNLLGKCFRQDRLVRPSTWHRSNIVQAQITFRPIDSGGRAAKRRCIDAQASDFRAQEPYRGPNSPVSGYKQWLPGGGLVHVQADVDQSVIVEAGAVVQEGSKIGRNSHIGSGSVVGPGVSIGKGVYIGHQAVLQHCRVGNRCTVMEGAKLGGKAFILVQQADGTIQKQNQREDFKVEVRDGVEIGANCIIDRGTWRDTVIDKGTMIDSLVHIGHDCMIGRSCILCAYASVGASTSLGDDIILGHRAAIKDHLNIVSKTRIAAKSGIVRDITDAGDYAGHPAVKADEFKQQIITSMNTQGGIVPAE